MKSHLLVSVAAPDATADEIADITRELADWIGDTAPDCQVAPETTAGQAGDKGILEVLGSLGVKFLEPFEQLVFVGALFPVATFAYRNKPTLKSRPGCDLFTMASADQDLKAALQGFAGTDNNPAGKEVRP